MPTCDVGLVIDTPLKLARGAVIRGARYFLIVTHDGNGRSIGWPVRHQTAPRHRSEVQLSADECRASGMPARAMIVLTNQSRAISPSRTLSVLGMCTPALINRIEQTARRAEESARFEAETARPAPTPMRPAGFFL